MKRYSPELYADMMKSLWKILVDGFPLEKPEGPVLDKESGLLTSVWRKGISFRYLRFTVLNAFQKVSSLRKH